MFLQDNLLSHSCKETEVTRCALLKFPSIIHQYQILYINVHFYLLYCFLHSSIALYAVVGLEIHFLAPSLLLPHCAQCIHLHIAINLENPHSIPSSIFKGHSIFQPKICTYRIYYICVKSGYKVKRSFRGWKEMSFPPHTPTTTTQTEENGDRAGHSSWKTMVTSHATLTQEWLDALSDSFPKFSVSEAHCYFPQCAL